MSTDISLERHEKYMKMIRTCKDDGFQNLCKDLIGEEFNDKITGAYYTTLLHMIVLEMQKRLVLKGVCK